MRFAQTTVSEAGLWDAAANPLRVARLADLLARLRDDGVGLLALPAGYLTVASEMDVPSAAATVADLVDQFGVAVVAGVDVVAETENGATDLDDMVRGGRLPFFGFAARPTPTEPEVPMWRQASVASEDADLAPEDRLPTVDRLVRAADRGVAVLLSGELFNWRALARVAESGPDVVCDLGHARMGQGLIAAMTTLARLAGRPVAHSQHLRAKNGQSHHFVAADGSEQSAPTEGGQYLDDGKFWIGWHVREV